MTARRGAAREVEHRDDAGIAAQITGGKPSALAEKHDRRRPLDLLRKWHAKAEAWMLEEAGVQFDALRAAHAELADWLWALVKVDPAMLDDTLERVNISLPRRVLHRLDARARSAGETRSRLIVGYSVQAARVWRGRMPTVPLQSTRGRRLANANPLTSLVPVKRVELPTFALRMRCSTN